LKLNGVEHLPCVGSFLVFGQGPVTITIEVSDDPIRDNDTRREVEVDFHTALTDRETGRLQVLVQPVRRQTGTDGDDECQYEPS
jgi:hypothetical protein